MIGKIGRNRSLWRAVALAASLALTAPLAAQAQIACPPGYYYASDGNCYPGPPPSYPQPAYDYAPPVASPPVVFDGFLLGLGLLIGGLAAGDHGGDRGRPQERGGPDEHGHR